MTETRHWDGQRWLVWDGSAWVVEDPVQVRSQVVYVQQVRPAATAHGAGYWLLVGWWWGPIKFVGRVCLWLLFWPVGLWRSIAHGRRTRELKAQRGRPPA